MSDVPGGSPLDVLRQVDRTVNAAAQYVQPIVQRRRNIAYTDAVTQARRRTNKFLTDLRDNPEYESYDVQWEERKTEIANDIAQNLGDPVVQEQFYTWWQQESETARQKVGEHAWSREVAHGVTVLEEGVEAAHEMSDYGQRKEQIRFVVESAQASGYLNENEAARILNREYERVFMDQASDTLDEVYSDGGYDQALNWVQSDNGTNEAQRSDLMTRLNRLDAQAQRRFRERQQQSVNTQYEGIYSGDTTVRGILSDAYLDANQQEWLIGKLRQITEAEQELGEGATADAGKRTLARLQTELDRGRDRIEVMEEADQAYLRGEISRTDRDAIRGYEALEEFNPYWNDLEETIKELELPMADTLAEARQRLQGLLFVKTGPNTWSRNTNLSEKEVQQYFENVERELSGERIIEQASRRDFRRGERQFGQGVGIADPYNTAEDNLRAIDQGQVIGYRDDEEYAERLNEMSFEHKRMFESTPFTENVRWAGFDRDGRPVFTAMTPVGERAIAWFMIDPNTKEEYEDEQPYYWDRDTRQWRTLPQTDIPESARWGRPEDHSATGGYDPSSGTARPQR